MPKHPEVLGHWHSLIDGFSTSTLDFYGLVKAGIARREIPDLAISEVEWREGGLGSGRRIYLRVSREHFNFDICAAPFGTGFFFSWWLARIQRPFLDIAVLLGILLSGALYLKIFLRAGEDGQMPGCGAAVFGALLFFGLLLAFGAFVRYGNQGIEPTVLSMPITGFLYGLVFRPVTYFNEDTAIMFRETVHQAVLESVDAVTSAQGVRGLSEEARNAVFSPWSKGS
jgi:hypothetical protein